MYNQPQMGPMQLPDVPTTKELWKNEKSKYRHWILLFGIGISIIFALQLTSFIFNMISQDDIKQTLQNSNGNYKFYDVNQVFLLYYTLSPAFSLSFIALGLLLFIKTAIDSYKRKSFAKISQWATMLIGISTLISVFNLFRMIWSPSSRIMLEFDGGIFKFINYFITIFIYFSVSIQVSRIRRLFAISERVEQLKNDPVYQQQMKMYNEMMKNGGAGMQMGPMGPMGPMPTTPTANRTNNTNTPINQPINKIPEENISKEEKELKAMTISQLRLVAKELSISGTKTMKKKELIEAILRVTQK